MLCLNGQEDHDEEFGLSVFADVDCSLGPTEDLFAELGHRQSARGEWKEGQSGGNISEVTFTRNPSYLLRAPKNCRLLVQITSEGRTPLGLYVIRVNEEKTLTQIAQSELEHAQATGSFLTGSNSLYVETAGEEELLLVVPCAYSSKTVDTPHAGSRFRTLSKFQPNTAAFTKRAAPVREAAPTKHGRRA